LTDLNEKILSPEYVFEEVYGDDLEKPINNDNRYGNWRDYVTKPTAFEKNLGSTFEAQTNDQYRLKRMQEQVPISITDRRKYEYEEKSGVLKYYLNERHLQDVYSIAGEMKNYIKENELLPTLLAIYELKLFLETGRVLDDYVIRKIFADNYFSGRSKDFRQDQNHYRSATIYFFHALNKIIRDLYTGAGKIFHNKSSITRIFGESVKTFIDTYLFEKLEIDLLQGRKLSQEYVESFKAMKAPRLFTKAMLSLHIKQQFQEIALQLNKCHYQSAKLNPEILHSLSDQFMEKYLHSEKWIKTSYGIGLSLLKDYDPELVQTIVEDKEIDNFYPTFYNVKIRHGKFFNELSINIPSINESPQEETILQQTQKQEEVRSIEVPRPEIIHEDCVQKLLQTETELQRELVDDYNILIDSEKKFTHINKYLGIKEEEFLLDRPYLTFIALHQLELLFRWNVKLSEKSLHRLIVDMEEQYEFRRKRKKKLWSIYLHRLNKLILSLNEDDSRIVDTTNDYIKKLRKGVQNIVQKVTQDYHMMNGPHQDDQCNCKMYYRCMAMKTMFEVLF
jgi:hypothetical protein